MENDEASCGEASGTRWIAVADATALRREAFRRISASAARAIEQRGRFLFVLAGGSTPRDTYRMLRSLDTDWSRWHFYFSDERCLPTDDPERNSRIAAETWLDHVPVPPANVHAIPAELGANDAALAYRKTLSGVGNFDLVLLGLGEDGHTASLFPGHDPGSASDATDVLPVFDAPKPPTQRVSLSAARLGRANEVIFLVEGEAKRHALRQWQTGDDIPARAIRPSVGVDVLMTSILSTTDPNTA